MMKSLLILGAVFFGAEAESQDFHKILAFARHLAGGQCLFATWTMMNIWQLYAIVEFRYECTMMYQ